MAKWIAICSSDDVKETPVRHRLPDDTDIALVRYSGQLLAMSNRCPHKDASLHKSGDIEDLGGDLGLCLRCPKHAKKFGGGLYVSFTTGQAVTRTPCSKSEKVAKWTVPVYETKESGGIVSVRQIAEAARTKAKPPKMVASVDEQKAKLAACVVGIRRVSHDSHVFTLRLVNEGDRAVFVHEPAVMWHIWLVVAGVSREYTPISSCVDTAKSGTIELLIKLYDDGSMSKQLAKLTTGDVVAVSQPRVTLKVPVLEERSLARGLSFNLLAGGTGIAPCLQLLRRAKDARAKVRLLYSSWTQENVLLASELEELAASWPDQGFSYTLVLTRAMAEDGGSQPKRPRNLGAAVVSGTRITATIMKEHLVAERAGAMVEKPPVAMTIISGPAGFNKCCEDLVHRTMLPAQRGEAVVLDA